MRFTSSQNSFRSGKLSKKLFQRIESQQYRDGASQLQNARVLPEGGVDRLRGTRWVDDGSATTEGKLFTVVVNGNPVKCLITTEFDDPIWTTNLITQAYPYSASPTVTPLSVGGNKYDAEGFDWAMTDKTIVLTHVRGDMAPIYIGFDDDGIATSRQSLGMFGYTQGDENLYPGVLSSAMYTNKFASRVYPFSDVDKYGDLTIGTLSAGQFNVTSTDAAVATILKRSTWVYLEGLGHNNFGGANAQSFVVSCFCLVTDNTVTDGVKVIPEYMYTPAGGGTATSIVHLGGLTTVSTWAYPLWWHPQAGGTYKGNFPRTVTAHEGRIILGGTKQNATTIFGSSVNSNYHFNQLRYLNTLTSLVAVPSPSGDTVVTDPFVLKIRAKEDSQITFLQSAENLVIGTDRKEYIASGGDTILSALSVNVKPVSAQGSVQGKSVSTGKAVYYLSSEGKQLFKFKYNDANGSFVSQELSLLFSDKLELDSIKQVEWVPHIQSLLILMESGVLYGLTQNDQSDIVAFYETGITGINAVAFMAVRTQTLHDSTNLSQHHRGDHVLLLHETYGLLTMEQLFYERGVTQSGVVEDVVAQNAYLFYERSCVQSRVFNTPVEFKFNGTAYTYAGSSSGTNVDKWMIPTDIYPPGTDLMFVDLLTMTEYPYTVQANPLAYAFLPCLDDNINAVSTHILMGLATARPMQVATMPVEAGQQWGTAQMGIKNIDTIGVRFYKTYSFEFSSDDFVASQEVVVADENVKCTSSRTEKKFTSNPRYDQIVYIRNTRAEPCTILGINMRGTSNDG